MKRAILVSLLGLWPPLAIARPNVLTVKVIVGEDKVFITQRLDIASGPTKALKAMPMLRPEGGPLPKVALEGDSDGEGLKVETRGAIAVGEIKDAVLLKVGGDGQVEARYALPIRSTSMRFILESQDLDLDGVRFVTRKTPSYSPQLRPLAPYHYAEEDTEDGTWQMMTLLMPLNRGERVEVALLHLPQGFSSYRLAILGGVGLIILGFIGAALSPRRSPDGP